MVKFFLTGFREREASTLSKYHLFLPSSKQPVPLPSSEPARKTEERRRSRISEDKRSLNSFISEAVHEQRSSLHIQPTSSSTFGYISPIDKPGALNYLLSKHPFPLNQGPVIIPIDNGAAWDYEKAEQSSPKGVFETRTMFTHADTQECFEWAPTLT